MQVKTLVIPAAGAGTRLRPATYVAPKELLRLVDKPIVYYLLAEGYQAGIRNVLCVTHKDNTQTKRFFESAASEFLLADFPGLNVQFVETDQRGGDGQALLLAEEFVGTEPFAVTMGDLVTLPGQSILAELVPLYGGEVEGVISIEEIPREKTGQYGVIDPGENNRALYHVRGIVEKPQPEVAPSNLAMTGKYVLPPTIFHYLRQLAGGEGELKLANALNAFAKEHQLFALAPETKHYDTGTKLDLLAAEVAFSLAHPDLKDKAREVVERLLKQ